MDYVRLYAINLQTYTIDFVEKVENKQGDVGTYGEYSTIYKQDNLNYHLFIGINGKLCLFEVEFEFDKSMVADESGDFKRTKSIKEDSLAAAGGGGAADSTHRHIDLRNTVSMVTPMMRGVTRVNSSVHLAHAVTIASNHQGRTPSHFRIRPETVRDLMGEFSKNTFSNSQSNQGDERREEPPESVPSERILKKNKDDLEGGKHKNTNYPRGLEVPTSGNLAIPSKRRTVSNYEGDESVSVSRSPKVHYTINVNGDRGRLPISDERDLSMEIPHFSNNRISLQDQSLEQMEPLNLKPPIPTQVDSPTKLQKKSIGFVSFGTDDLISEKAITVPPQQNIEESVSKREGNKRSTAGGTTKNTSSKENEPNNQDDSPAHDLDQIDLDKGFQMNTQLTDAQAVPNGSKSPPISKSKSKFSSKTGS